MNEYAKIFNDYPLLSEQRERQLSRILRNRKASQYKKNRAREEMALSNQKLVKKIAYKYITFTPSLTEEDLISTGNEGLMHAIDTYNPLKYHTRFGTFAYKLINNAILNSLYIMGCPVTVPSNIVVKTSEYKKIRNGEKQWTDMELKAKLGVTDRALLNIKNMSQKMFSFNQPVLSNEDDSDYSLADIIASKDINVDTVCMNREKKQVLKTLISNLKEREKQIILCLYYRQKTLSETGKMLELSGERVRQIERIILRKLGRQIKSITRGEKYHVAL
jgi:RNA polymerase sigma factor (sigma-70 family)